MKAPRTAGRWRRAGPVRASRARPWLAALIVGLLGAALARADVALPPAPKDYFNDYASLVPADDASRMNGELRSFDEQTSNQILVAIFPSLPEPSLEDFTIRTAQSWRVGQKKLNNGAVLFLFVQDRKSRIEVGYGLEGALPDATCKDILEDRLAPKVRQGDYAGGLEDAIQAMMAATKGEYKAAGKSPPAGIHPPSALGNCAIFVIVIAVIILRLALRTGWRTFGGRGWSSGGWGGGGWGGGGWSGGGGGFSGGGGSFGGGGSSGSW